MRLEKREDKKGFSVVGRVKDNLRRIYQLCFDCDLKDWPKMIERFGSLEDAASRLHTMEDEELQGLREEYLEVIRGVFRECGVPYSKVVSSGYGFYMLSDVETKDQRKIEELCRLNKLIIGNVNRAAGYNLCDTQASDGGTHPFRLEGSLNLKNPKKPRKVEAVFPALKLVQGGING